MKPILQDHQFTLPPVRQREKERKALRSLSNRGQPEGPPGAV